MTTTSTDLEITRATTIGGLSTGESMTAFSTASTVATDDTWAPEIHNIDGTYDITPSSTLILPP